jgi:hypothetical protein
VRTGNGGDTPGDRNVEKCLNCQFYDRRNARPTDGRAAMWGQCRRHSPHLNPVSAKSYLVEGVWPLIRDDDWCGEWRAPTLASMSRARPGARADELVMPVTAAVSTSADHAVSPVSLVASAAGDD